VIGSRARRQRTPSAETLSNSPQMISDGPPMTGHQLSVTYTVDQGQVTYTVDQPENIETLLRERSGPETGRTQTQVDTGILSQSCADWMIADNAFSASNHRQLVKVLG
jgi:hypothetical protein